MRDAVSTPDVEAIDSVIRQWRLQDVQLNSGAEESELLRLQDLLDVELPADVRYYFRTVNGLQQDEYVGNGLYYFLSIEHIVAEPISRAGVDERGSFRDIAFVDGMLSAWFIYFRIRGSALSIYLEMEGLELPSLAEFFRYMNGKKSSYFW